MTSPASYLFYDDDDPVYEAGTYLTRILISEKKMTIRRVMLTSTGQPGVLREHSVSYRHYFFCENSRGERYIRIGDSQYSLHSAFHQSHAISLSEINIEGSNLIEDTFQKWSGVKYPEGMLHTVWDKIQFPSLRSGLSPSLESNDLEHYLKPLHAITHSVTGLLIECSSWDDFIAKMCKPTVESNEDVELIRNNFKSLASLGTMEWGESISSLYSKNPQDLLSLGNNLFKWFDLNVIKFMVKHLSETDRASALDLLLETAKLYRPNTLSAGETFVRAKNYNTSSIPFNHIPKERRHELGKEILNWIEDCRDNVIELTMNSDNPTEELLEVFSRSIDTNFMDNLQRWFATEIMEPRLKSVATVEDIGNRFMQLFGKRLPHSFSLGKELKQGDFEFFTFVRPSKKFGSMDSGINYLVRGKERPTEKGFKGWNLDGHIKDDKFIVIPYAIYSLDDYLTFLDVAVAKIDKALSKLGRSITPNHRTAYLAFFKDKQKFKNAWWYYDAGAIDPKRILALKKARITSESDVAMFSALPDELFYELLSLQTGKTILPEEI